MAPYLVARAKSSSEAEGWGLTDWRGQSEVVGMQRDRSTCNSAFSELHGPAPTDRQSPRPRWLVVGGPTGSGWVVVSGLRKDTASELQRLTDRRTMGGDRRAVSEVD